MHVVAALPLSLIASLAFYFALACMSSHRGTIEKRNMGLGDTFIIEASRQNPRCQQYSSCCFWAIVFFGGRTIRLQRMAYLSLGSLCAALAALMPAAIASKPLFSSAFGYPGINATYDYVVVGGGTAGLTLAARLAEAPHHPRVAVVEAGSFYETTNGNNSVVPLLSLVGMAFLDPTDTFLPQPLMDWSLLSEPIAHADGRRVHYAQGKTLGGTSAINTMSYVRANRGAYDRWAEVVGDASYGFDEMLPFFRRSVQLTPPDAARRNSTNVTVAYDPAGFADEDGGGGGPLQVSWNNYVDPALTWLAKIIEKGAGLPLSAVGFETGALVGHGAWVPGTIEPARAVRSSSESSFLREAVASSSSSSSAGTGIVIYILTQATRVLFDEDPGEAPRATGVRVSSLGVEYTLTATKEVIVSAGTFHSPQLLMVSGTFSPLSWHRERKKVPTELGQRV